MIENKNNLLRIKFFYLVFLLLLISPILIGSYSSAIFANGSTGSGRDVGNGGDVIICQNIPEQETTELLDFFEARVLRGISPDISAIELSEDDVIELAGKVLDRINTIDSNVHVVLNEYLNSFMDEASFISKIELVDVLDSMHVLIPINCQTQQIAVHREPKYLEDKRYIINKELWDKLDHLSKAALVVHEVLYRLAIEKNHISNSESIRYLNSLLFANMFKSRSDKTLMQLFRELGSENIKIGKHLVNLSVPLDDLEFYQNGKLRKALVKDGIVIKKEGKEYHFPGSALAWFDSNREIEKIDYYYWSRTNNHFKEINLKIDPDKEIQFHESGNIKSAWVKDGSYINAYDGHIPLTDRVCFYDEKNLKINSVYFKDIIELNIADQKIKFQGIGGRNIGPIDTTLVFSQEEEAIIGGHLVPNLVQTISTENYKLNLYGANIWFHPNGNIRWAQNCLEANIFKDGLPWATIVPSGSAFGYVRSNINIFSIDLGKNGQYLSSMGILRDSIIVNTANNELVTLEKNNYFQLSDKGELISGTLKSKSAIMVNNHGVLNVAEYISFYPKKPKFVEVVHISTKDTPYLEENRKKYFLGTYPYMGHDEEEQFMTVGFSSDGLIQSMRLKDDSPVDFEIGKEDAKITVWVSHFFKGGFKKEFIKTEHHIYDRELLDKYKNELSGITLAEPATFIVNDRFNITLGKDGFIDFYSNGNYKTFASNVAILTVDLEIEGKKYNLSFSKINFDKRGNFIGGKLSYVDSQEIEFDMLIEGEIKMIRSPSMIEVNADGKLLKAWYNKNKFQIKKDDFLFNLKDPSSISVNSEGKLLMLSGFEGIFPKKIFNHLSSARAEEIDDGGLSIKCYGFIKWNSDGQFESCVLSADQDLFIKEENQIETVKKNTAVYFSDKWGAFPSTHYSGSDPNSDPDSIGLDEGYDFL